MKIQAKKHLGQNFLIDDTISQKIVDFYDIESKNIVEVGPGYGALSEKLLQKNIGSVRLIELDIDMVRVLQNRIQSGDLHISKNLDYQIIQRDILSYTPEYDRYIVIANIPYYITSPILFHFLYDIPNPPEKMLIMMQKEVGERILENISRKRKNSLLSVAMWKKCDVTEVCKVPKTAFSPAPKVDSIVLGFERKNTFEYIDDKKFIIFLQQIFKEPRKTLINNLLKTDLQKDYILASFRQLNIQETIRSESLSVLEIAELFCILFKN